MEDRGKREKKRGNGVAKKDSKLAVELLHRNRVVMMAALG